MGDYRIRLNKITAQVCAVAACIILPIIALNAVTLDINADLTQKAISGITNASSLIISDAFDPMTHSHKGDLSAKVVPCLFKVSKIYDKPAILSDNLMGVAAGVGAGYALSDRWIWYGIFASINTGGDVYARHFKFYKINLDYNLYSFFSGFGFDVAHYKDLSIPIYIGISVQGYDTAIRLKPLPFSYDILSNKLEGIGANTTKGSGALFGYSASVAISYLLLKRYKVSPYFLFYRTINKPYLSSRFTFRLDTPFPGFYRQNTRLKMQIITAYMLGLSVSAIASKNWSVSVSR